MEIFFDEPDRQPDERKRRKTQKTIEEILNGPEEQDASRPPQPPSVFGTHEPAPDEPTTNSTAFGRILNETAGGVAKKIRRHGPLGLTPEQMDTLRRRGVFNDESDVPLSSDIVDRLLHEQRELNEAIIPPAAVLLDGGQLAIEAAMRGIHDGGSQALQELGFSRSGSDLFMRDFLGFIEQHLRRFR